MLEIRVIYAQSQPARSRSQSCFAKKAKYQFFEEAQKLFYWAEVIGVLCPEPFLVQGQQVQLQHFGDSKIKTLNFTSVLVLFNDTKIFKRRVE